MQWDNVFRRGETKTVNSDVNVFVEGMKEKERPKKEWIEFLESDMKMTKVCEDNAKDRSKNNVGMRG